MYGIPCSLPAFFGLGIIHELPSGNSVSGFLPIPSALNILLLEPPSKKYLTFEPDADFIYSSEPSTPLREKSMLDWPPAIHISPNSTLEKVFANLEFSYILTS